MKYNLIQVIILLTFISCGENYEETNQLIKTESSKDKSDSSLKKRSIEVTYYKSLLKPKIIGSNQYLIEVKDGNLLRITISGKKYTPQFSRVRDVSLQSRWIEKKCIKIPIPSMSGSKKKKHCFKIPRKGTCILRYRDYLKEKEERLYFSNKSKDFRIKLKLGGNKYSLGKVINSKGFLVTTEFKVSEEMIRDTNKLELVIIPLNKPKNIKTGFIGYGPCQGKGQRRFTVGGNKSSRNISNKIRSEYKIQIDLKNTRLAHEKL